MNCQEKEHLVRAKFAMGHVPQASLLKANYPLKGQILRKLIKKNLE